MGKASLFKLFLFLGILKAVVLGYSGRTTVLNGEMYKWTHHTKIEASPMEISWIDSDKEYVTMELKGHTRGYVAIGFSPTGGMNGADILVGWVSSNGTANILDMFATSNGQPVMDKRQDVELLGGSENGEETSIVFRRKWNTRDEEDFPIGDDTIRLIWAINDNDPVVEDSTAAYVPGYHGRDGEKRGVKSIFMKMRPPHSKFPDEEDVYPKDVKHVDLTVHNVTVPKTEQYYHCNIIKLPRLESKHHIIAYRPLIAPESRPHVHHICIYKCHVPEILGVSTGNMFEKYVNQPGRDCFGDDAPREWTEYCFEFVVVLGAGSDGELFPEHVGDVIGDTEGSSYYRLEVHYENPTGKYLVDSSGFRLFYTSTLRQYEIAVLFSGHRITPFMTIPPHQKAYKIYGFCGAACTSQGIPKEGIKIISVLLHAHMAATKIILKHVRNGRELAPIAQDNHYDFNYQQFRALPVEVLVLPGDELITECTYNTEYNDTFLYGGLPTRREMCQSLITYYPKSALINCRSQPELYSYLNAIGVNNAAGKLLDILQLPYSSKNVPEKLKDFATIDDSILLETGRVDVLTSDIFQNVTITSPQELYGEDLHEYMMDLPWNDTEYTRSVEENLKGGHHYLHCSIPGGLKLPTAKDVYAFPSYVPYEAPQGSYLPEATSEDSSAASRATYSSAFFYAGLLLAPHVLKMGPYPLQLD